MMLLLAAAAAAIIAALLTRGGISRRLPAALIPVAVWALATQPLVPWPGAAVVSLRTNATLAEVEAVLASTPAGGVIDVGGDGVHPEFLPLLADRVIRWEPPTDRLGLVELSWPRRVAVGEAIRVIGRLDVADSVTVLLTTPEGATDSMRTDSSFAFTVVARAAGRWTMHLRAGRDTTTLGFHAVVPPRLRVMVIAGRPDFEVPALVRRLATQDADVTVRTQMTRERRRVEQHGLTPLPAQLSAAVLDSLDLVVLAAGGAATLTAAEQRLVAAAVDGGLGVIHLTDAPVGAGPLAPFPIRAAGAEWSARLALEDQVWPGVVRVAALTAADSLAFLRDSTDRALAWKAQRGRGVVAATALVQSHRLPLAGHPETEVAWWAALLGPVLRAPSGRWLVDPDAIVAENEPVVLRWLGVPPPVADVVEGADASRAGLISDDSSNAALRVWPSDTGWMSVSGGSDTLALLVAGPEALPGIAAARRREAMAAVAAEPTANPPTGRVPLPRAIGWLLLVAAVAVGWRPR